LSWFDDRNNRYLRPEELVTLAQKEVEDTKAQLAQALARIKELEGS
jgi:hypothetical protein